MCFQVEGVVGPWPVVVGGGGDVPPAGLAGEADGEVAEGRHRAGRGSGANAASILGEGHVPHVVQGLDLPVPTDQFGGLGCGGLLRGEVGDRLDRLDGLSGRAVRTTTLDVAVLDGMRKEQARLDRADFEAAYKLKGSSSRNAVRMAIGQLHDYSRHIPNKDARLVVMLPEKSVDDLAELVAHVGMDLVYKDGDKCIGWTVA